MKSSAIGNKRRRSSIRAKFVGAVLVGIATATVLITAASGWREAVRFSEVKRAEAEATAHVLASAVADAVADNDRMGVLKALRAIGRIPYFEYAKVTDADGRVVGDLGAAVTLVEKPDTPLLLRSTLEAGVPVIKDGRRIGTVTVLVNTDELRQRLVESSATGLLAAFLSAAIGIAVALRLQDRITRPLRDLTTRMLDIRRTEDFTGQVDYSADDETGVLVDAFNDMLDEIRQRDSRLARHRETLELTVEERTRELRIAKESAEEANAAKSDFLAVMSHEIRTPMNGMLVMAELLSSANLSERHRRYADVVVKSGQSLLTIINDILDFSKIESGKMQLECIDLDPSAVIDDVLSLYWEKAHSKRLDLAGYVAPDVPATIAGDPVRLNQVLSNLVNNALKFTETGYVEVRLERVELNNAAALKFIVVDTGIGIAEDKLATVFEAFSQADQTTTRRFGGTGLGLAICKRLVGAMGGEISIASKEGEGSEFSFTVADAISGSPVAVEAFAATSNLRSAIVAVDGMATGKAIERYLADRGVATSSVVPEELTRTQVIAADVVFCEPKQIAELQEGAVSAKGSPYLISVSQLGDSLSEDLVAANRAHDMLIRPVARQTIHGLITRLEKGEPRGRTLLSRHKTVRLPAYPDAKVLVADDSPVNREVVTEALRQMGVAPDVVEDGAAAVSAAAGKPYDLIFMDCSMPTVDGFEAARRIREAEKQSGRHVPIIALTAHVAGAGANEWRNAGMDDYMSKPFRIGDLVTRFDRFLPTARRDELPDADLSPVGERQIEQLARSFELGDAEQPASDAEQTDRTLETDARPLPVIDTDALALVFDCQDGGSNELVLRVLSLFEHHAPTALLALAESAQRGSKSEIAAAAHALKSMGSNIGAARLCRECESLEASARRGDTIASPAKIARVQAEVVDVLARIKSLKTELQKHSSAA